MADDDERRPLAGWCSEVLVARRVVERVRSRAIGCRKLDRLRNRDIAGVDCQRRAATKRVDGTRCEVDSNDGVGLRGRAGDQHGVRIVRRQPIVRHDLRRNVASARRSPMSIVGEMPVAPCACTTRPAATGPANAHVEVPNTHCGLPNSARRHVRIVRDVRIARPVLVRIRTVKAPVAGSIADVVEGSRPVTIPADRSIRPARRRSAVRFSSVPAAVTSATHSSLPSHGMFGWRHESHASCRAVRAQSRRRVEVVARREDLTSSRSVRLQPDPQEC